MMASRPLVFVLDDDASTREVLTQAVEYGGYQPRPFATAPEAFAALAIDWPAAILLDQRMAPVDGIAFLEHVQREWGRVPPCVLLTAYLPAHDTQGVSAAAAALGVRFVLTKPSDLEKLLAALAAAVETAP